MIMPRCGHISYSIFQAHLCWTRTPHTNIGDSEHTGGMQSYCSASARSDSSQGELPAQFWRNVAFKSGAGKNGGRYAQCAHYESIRFLNHAYLCAYLYLPSQLTRIGSDRLHPPRDGGPPQPGRRRGAIRLERRGGWEGKSPGVCLYWVCFKFSSSSSTRAL